MENKNDISKNKKRFNDASVFILPKKKNNEDKKDDTSKTQQKK